MKKGILLLNGQPYSGQMDATDAEVWCCDGAYNWANGRIRIDKTVGDFDSCNCIPYPLPQEIYPTEKDFTDGEIALKKMLESGIDDIVVYGGGGGREDHFLGNLQLLYLAHISGAICKMVTQNSILFVGGGKINLNGLCGKTVSVLPFCGNVHIIGSAGLKYAYPNILSHGICRGISNVVTDEKAEIDVAEGQTVLVIINRGSV